VRKLPESDAKTIEAPGSLPEVRSNPDATFAQEVAAKSHQEISRCYQCLRCVGGCPMAAFTDRGPADILRLVLLGAKEEVLASPAIWMCTSCETCAARCPMEISMSRVNDELRRRAVKESFVAPDNKLRKFHTIFLNITKTRGRMNEPLLMGHYKWQTREFTQDLQLGIQMIRKRKMNPFVGKLRRAAEIRKLFEEKK
jgi:heterodisulfide reductase subunit C